MVDHPTTAAETAACLNCGTALSGKHCQECGQRAHIHHNLAEFLHDLLHGAFHFEGKIWRTLPMLVWRPGELTRRYLDGERVRFVSPVGLFLFCAFLTFVVFNSVGGPISLAGGRTSQNFQQGLVESAKEADEQVQALERERSQIAARGGDTKAIDSRLKEARDGASMVRLMKERGVAEATVSRAADDLPAGTGWFGRAVEKAKQNPDLLIYKLQNNAYKYSWALIPISVPFLWLLFPFSRRFGLYDHTVFITYSLCFVTILAVVLSLLRQAGLPNPAILSALTFLPPLHMYRQLRGAYRLGRLGALWRTFALVIFAFIAASLFLALLLALGIMG